MSARDEIVEAMDAAFWSVPERSWVEQMSVALDALLAAPAEQLGALGLVRVEARNERIKLVERNLGILRQLIADLSSALADEGDAWSHDGVHELRIRTANALPHGLCPDWLEPYRDPAVIRALAPARTDGGEK